MTRPVLNYFGGKFRIAEWIISFLPKHNIYVEPFGGAASVLMRKQPAKFEIYNDIDSEVVNVFSCIRADASRLVRSLKRTPFARSEFYLALEKTDDKFEQARRTIIRSLMGMGSAIARNTGFRITSKSSGTVWHAYRRYPSHLSLFAKRLRDVAIENVPAAALIRRFMDHRDCLMYIDPPYPLETRYTQKGYTFEMSDEQHKELVSLLAGAKCMIALSSYRNPVYDELGWFSVSRKVRTMKSAAIETLYLNQACLDAGMNLFSERQ